MTRYEQDMYQRDIPSIRKSLESISESLKTIITIISDPGDEVEHILDAPKEMKRIWNGKLGEKSDYVKVYPFKEGDTYFTIEDDWQGNLKIVKSCWDDGSEEHYNPKKEYYRTRIAAQEDLENISKGMLLYIDNGQIKDISGKLSENVNRTDRQDKSMYDLSDMD